MRELTDAERLARFMRELGAAARTEATCHLTGGATAVPSGRRALERGHERDLEDRDLEDVGQLGAAGMVERGRLLGAFAEIEPSLYRFPAVDPARFRARVEEAAG